MMKDERENVKRTTAEVLRKSNRKFLRNNDVDNIGRDDVTSVLLLHYYADQLS